MARSNRNFYRNTDTGEIFVIETSWQGELLASFGPVTGDRKPLSEYDLSTVGNARLKAINDKLILME